MSGFIVILLQGTCRDDQGQQTAETSWHGLITTLLQAKKVYHCIPLVQE